MKEHELADIVTKSEEELKAALLRLNGAIGRLYRDLMENPEGKHDYLFNTMRDEYNHAASAFTRIVLAKEVINQLTQE